MIILFGTLVKKTNDRHQVSVKIAYTSLQEFGHYFLMNSWRVRLLLKIFTKTVGKFVCAFQTATHVVRERGSRQGILLMEFNSHGLTVTIFYFQ
jgi:hypothetical protein